MTSSSMMALLTYCAVSCATLRAQEPSQAQKDSSFFVRAQSLQGRSGLRLALGFLDLNTRNAVQSGGRDPTSSTVRPMLNLEYAYWFESRWAVAVRVGFLSSEQKFPGELQEESSRAVGVFPFLFGIRYFIPPRENAPKLCWSLAMAGGPYFGVMTTTAAELSGSTTAAGSSCLRTEVALGVQVDAGVDYFIGDSFILGAVAGYHFISDFKNPGGVRKNHSGYEIALVVGYLWGGGGGP